MNEIMTARPPDGSEPEVLEATISSASTRSVKRPRKRLLVANGAVVAVVRVVGGAGTVVHARSANAQKAELVAQSVPLHQQEATNDELPAEQIARALALLEEVGGGGPEGMICHG